MKKLVMVSAIVLAATCGAAVAQSTTAPAKTPAETAAPSAAEREASRAAQAPAETRPGDPNTTGPDKVNGMEVPATKGEAGSGR